MNPDTRNELLWSETPNLSKKIQIKFLDTLLEILLFRIYFFITLVLADR